MAGIIINSNGARTNPTNNFLPVNLNGAFEDSPIRVDSDLLEILQTIFSANEVGFKIDSADNAVTIGKYDEPTAVKLETVGTDECYLGVDKDVNPASIVELRAGAVGVNASEFNISPVLISGTAGAASGNYLVIQVSGTPYKINLLNA